MKNKFINILKIIFVILTALILFAGCGTNSNDIDKSDNNIVDNNNGQAKVNDENEQADDDLIIDDPNAKVEIGYPAPDFKFELLNGETGKLSDYRGKAVFINFWATWCKPCVGEMPDIQKLSEAYADDLIVLAINCGDKKNKVDNFIADNGYTFNIVLDESGEIQDKYPTKGIPYTIIVNPEGIITQIRLGAGNDMFSIYEEYVKNALGK